jgi:hypothetical protein
MTPAQMAEAAMARIRAQVNRSAGQHLLHIRRAFERARR